MKSCQSSSSQKIKRKVQRTIRNILTLPQEYSCPVVPTEELEHLSVSLKEALQHAKLEKPKIPWQKLQNLSKEERRKLSDELIRAEPEINQKKIAEASYHRSFLLLGINSVLRGIDGGSVALCLVEEEVNPQILTKYVTLSAKNARIPVFVFPKLKEITKSGLGFSCLALGFKSSVMENESNKFFKICDYLKKIAGHEELKKEENVKFLGINCYETWFPETTSESNGDTIEANSQNLFLYRDSDDSRVFSSATLGSDSKEEHFMPVCSGEMVGKLFPTPPRFKERKWDRDVSNKANGRPFEAGKSSRHKSEVIRYHEAVPKFFPSKIQRIQSNSDKFRKLKKLKTN